MGSDGRSPVAEGRPAVSFGLVPLAYRNGDAV